MQNRKPHSQKAPQTGHSIFGTILFSLLAVLAVEFLLLTFAALQVPEIQGIILNPWNRTIQLDKTLLRIIKG